MNKVYVAIVATTALLGPILGFIAARWPMYFWHALIVGAILGSGPKIEGQGFADEYFLGCVLLGPVVASLLKGRRTLSVSRPRVDRAHRGLFVLLMLYLVLQSVRGMLVAWDWRVVRFALLFGALAYTARRLTSSRTPVPPAPTLLRLTAWSCLAYMAAYLVTGYFAEAREFINTSLGAVVGRMDLQYYGWTGTTVAVIPGFVALAVAQLQLGGRALQDRLMGWAGIMLCVAVAFYYESRTLMFAILGCIVLALPSLGLRKALMLTGVVGAVSLGFLWQGQGGGEGEGLKDVGTGLLESLYAFSGEARESDKGRRLDLIAALETVSDDAGMAFWGAGWYQHRELIVPHRMELSYRYGGDLLHPGTNLHRPAAFSALLIDTGALGVVLLLGCFLRTAKEIVTLTRGRGTAYRWPLLLCLGFMGISVFVGICTDLVLLYFVIMPAGLLVQLARTRAEERPASGEPGSPAAAGGTGP